MLLYYRCYITCEFLSYLFNCHETTVIRSVRRIEKIAVQVVHIEKKREITSEETEYLITDASEQPVQRRKKVRKNITAGRRKGIPLKHSMLSVLTEKSAPYPGHIREKPMISIYIRIRKTETVFTVSRKKRTADIREYRNMILMPKFLLKNRKTQNSHRSRNCIIIIFRKNV